MTAPRRTASSGGSPGGPPGGSSGVLRGAPPGAPSGVSPGGLLAGTRAVLQGRVRPALRGLLPRGLLLPGVLLPGLLVSVLLAACSAAPSPSPAPEPSPELQVTEPEPSPDPWATLVVTATVDPVEVFEDPASPSPSLTVSGADVVSYPQDTPVTFLVVEDAEGAGSSADASVSTGAGTTQDAPGWWRVALPGPVGVVPSGPDDLLDLPTGWVRASDVTVATTDYRLEVRLGEQRLLVHRADAVVLDVPVRLGPAAPHPGRTFLTELVTGPSAAGPYGAYAYGLAGYPTALAGFGSAAGLVGIHGGAPAGTETGDGAAQGDDPASGPGSVALTDADVTRLVTELGLPLGAPVDVVA